MEEQTMEIKTEPDEIFIPIEAGQDIAADVDCDEDACDPLQVSPQEESKAAETKEANETTVEEAEGGESMVSVKGTTAEEKPVETSSCEDLLRTAQRGLAPKRGPPLGHVPRRLRQDAPDAIDQICLSFGSYVANKLKTYRPQARNAVQHAISEILFKADQGLFDPNWDQYDQ